MNQIDAIFLDFDGVILESVDIKGWAFAKLFEAYPEHVDEIVAFHHANGGMSRFEKFRHIYREIFKKELPEQKFKKLCLSFSDLVYKRVLVCDFVPGALEFLKEYHKIFQLFVISGTPHEEINKIVRKKDLAEYFKGVFGSPTGKGHWTKLLIEEKKLDPKGIIFVGDAMSDYRAAVDNNIKFVARVDIDNEIFKDKKIYWKVKDLFELDNLISKEKMK